MFRSRAPVDAPLRAPSRLDEPPATGWERWRTERRLRTGPAAFEAAGLFVAVGVIGLVGDGLTSSSWRTRAIAIALDASTIVVGVLVALLPWQKWPPRAGLAIALLAFADIVLNIGAGVLPVATDGIWFALVFVWIGMWHPSRTSLWMVPPAVVAYLGPGRWPCRPRPRPPPCWWPSPWPP